MIDLSQGFLEKMYILFIVQGYLGRGKGAHPDISGKP